MIKIKQLKTHALVEKGCEAINWCAVYTKISKTVSSLNIHKNSPLPSEDVDDAVQDAFLKIWANIESYKSSVSKPITWMSKIAVNCYFDRLEANNKWKNLHGSYDDFSVMNGEEVTNALEKSTRYNEENEAFAEDLEGLLNLALEPLCDTYRKAIECLVNDVPREDMSGIIGCSEDNLRPSIHRARNATRNSLRKLGIL